MFGSVRYLAVLVTAVLCYAALGAVLGILPEYVRSLGGGALLIGFAVGAPALAGAAGRPLGGRAPGRAAPGAPRAPARGARGGARRARPPPRRRRRPGCGAAAGGGGGGGRGGGGGGCSGRNPRC